MRKSVRNVLAVCMLVFASMLVASLIIVMQLESYVDQKTQLRDQQYEQTQHRLDQIESNLCRIEPSTCVDS